MAIRVGVGDLIRNSNILKEYDYVEIEDKKTHKLRGIFVSGKVAEDFKRFLEEEKQKKIQEKLNALNNIIEFAKSSRNYFLDKFDKNDTKILQKVKGII